MLDSTVILAVYDESYGEHVIHAIEVHLLLLHLLPDGECGLGAGLELVFDTGFGERGLERLDELLGDDLPVAFGGF